MDLNPSPESLSFPISQYWVLHLQSAANYKGHDSDVYHVISAIYETLFLVDDGIIEQ